jgi:hypothetical protein
MRHWIEHEVESSPLIQYEEPTGLAYQNEVNTFESTQMARENCTFEFSCIVKERVLRVRGAIYRPALIDADIALAYKPVQNGRLVRASQIRDANSPSAAPTTD